MKFGTWNEPNVKWPVHPHTRPLAPPAQVLQRIFPVRRGLYEDYVANFW
jgi:hypothetical protein